MPAGLRRVMVAPTGQIYVDAGIGDPVEIELWADARGHIVARVSEERSFGIDQEDGPARMPIGSSIDQG